MTTTEPIPDAEVEYQHPPMLTVHLPNHTAEEILGFVKKADGHGNPEDSLSIVTVKDAGEGDPVDGEGIFVEDADGTLLAGIWFIPGRTS